MLVPAEARLQTADFIRAGKCQPGGSFELGALRPGEYTAFAFDDPPGMMEHSVFSTGALATMGTRVTVRPSEVTAVSLKKTPRR